MPLDLSHLRTFLEVARQQSYTRAGQRLHLSQSAVSHNMRRLEESVGRPLVEFQGRRFGLTPEGRRLLGVCERVFKEVEEAEQWLAGERRLHCVLGVTVEFGTTVVLRRARPFLEAHPELHLDFQFSNHLVQPLLRDEVDLAVDCHPHTHPSLGRVPLFRETWVVIAAPDFLTRHPVASPRDLESLPVLSLDREGEWWKNFLSALDDDTRPALQRVVQVNHVRGIIYAAIDGLGVGFVPRYSVLRELGAGHLVELFPRIGLLEDWFCVYQKRAHAHLEANRLVTEWLRGLDTAELGLSAR